jgi:hypothetical protein
LLSRAAAGRSAALALLVIGLAIGAGLVFTLNYTYDVLTPRTITTTFVVTSFVILTMPALNTSTSGFVQIQASTTTCQWTGSHEYCEVDLRNSGNLVTATTGNCSMIYRGNTLAGYTGPTLATATAPGGPQQLIPGTTRTAYCQASTGGAAGAGTQVTGTILLANGGEAIFSGNATS